MTGNRLTITDGNLIVEPLGMDKLWSFRRRIEIPLAHVKAAFFDPSVIDEPKGIRFPGLHLPGKVAGTFYANGKRQFWNIAGYHHAITIELDSAERFDRLVLSVSDPLRQADAINSARRSS
ncbi:hypothetical protein [Microbacterium sp. LWS13-1.2]|uniref:Bacterial Pleckstrin homology domain-containing protein n=1 Tax=Microbacterium sp. LWS13-1.2 TaxID=3135264 RepID=A0AAU6S8P2_9MICO